MDREGAPHHGTGGCYEARLPGRSDAFQRTQDHRARDPFRELAMARRFWGRIATRAHLGHEWPSVGPHSHARRDGYPGGDHDGFGVPIFGVRVYFERSENLRMKGHGPKGVEKNKPTITCLDNRSCNTLGEMLAGLYKGLSTANAPRLVSLRSSTADDSCQYKSVSVNIAIQRVRTARR